MSTDKLNSNNEWADYVNALDCLENSEPESPEAEAAADVATILGGRARSRVVRRKIVRPEIKRGVHISPMQVRAVRRSHA